MLLLTPRKRAIIAALFVIGIASILLIYASVQNGSGLASLDAAVAQWFVEHRSPAITPIMQIISHAFDPLIFVIALPLSVALWIWRYKTVWRPSLMLVTVGVSLALSTLIKELSQRSRPPFTDMILPLETGNAFPSNHTFAVALIVLILGYYAYTTHRSLRILANWILTTIVTISLMAISRMYLGYHWLTDVVASVGLALIVLSVVIIIDSIYQNRTTAPKVDP